MDNEKTYETFLYLNNKYFIIKIIKNNTLDKVYEEKYLIKDQSNHFQIRELENFLDKNVYKIEKKTEYFIETIHLILESDDFFSIKLSIKGNNNGNLITPQSLSYSLNEAKEQCAKSLEKKRIIHMLIDNYHFNNKDYSYLPKNTKCENFSLDLRFICISNDIVKNLEEILKKFQISINEILSAEYIKSLFNHIDDDLILRGKQVLDGFNQNEVKFSKKIIRNKGFFERFFNFFS